MQKVFVAYLIGKTFYHCLESKNVIVKQADRTVWLSPMATDLINAVTHSTDCSSIKFIDCSILIFFYKTMQLIHLTEAFNSSDENCRLKFWGEGGEEPFTIYFKIISQVPSLSISFTRWTHLHVKCTYLLLYIHQNYNCRILMVWTVFFYIYAQLKD